MRYLLKTGPLLSEELRIRLHSVGIENTDALLGRAAEACSRSRLAEKLGMSTSVVERLVSFADFVRVKGIGEKLAVLLALGGLVRSVQDLAQSPTETLLNHLRDVNRQYHILRRNPSRTMIRELREEAGELKPRVELSDSYTVGFARHLERLRSRTRRLDRWFFFRLVLIALGGLILSFAIPLLYAALPFLFESDPASPVEKALRELKYTVLWMVVLGVSSLVAWVLAAVMLGLVLMRAVDKFTTVLAPMFFRTSSERRTFVLFERVLRPTVASKWFGVALWLVVAAFASVIIVITFWPDSTEVLFVVMQATMIGVVLLVVVPVVLLGAKVTRRNPGLRWTAVWQLCQYRFVGFLGAILVLAIALRVLFPAALAGHRAVTGQLVVESYRAREEAQLGLIRKLPDEDFGTRDREVVVEMLDRRFPDLSSKVQNAILGVDGQGRPAEEPVLERSLPLVIGPLLLACFVFCFVPILVHRPGMAIAYTAALGVAWACELALPKLLSAAFVVPTGSVTLVLMFAMLIVFNSAVFESVTERVLFGVRRRR